MKKALMSVALVLLATSALAQFRDTTWGMSLEQVIAIEGRGEVHRDGDVTHMSVPVQLLGYTGRMGFSFFDGELFRGMYGLPLESYDRITAALHRRFGVPQEPEDGVTIWIDDDTFITLEREPNHGVTVQFWDSLRLAAFARAQAEAEAAAFGTLEWESVKRTPPLPSAGLSVAWSPNGGRLAVAHSGSPGLTVIDTTNWTVVTGTPRLPPGGPNNTVSANTVAWSPDGTHLAVTHVFGRGLTVLNTDNWSTVTGTPSLPDGGGRSIAWSPDGTRLAVTYGRFGVGLMMLSTANWSTIRRTPNLSSDGGHLAWSPDGTRLAVTHGSGAGLTVYNITNWSVINETPRLPTATAFSTWSPDGTRLAVTSIGSPGLTIIDTTRWTVVTGTPSLPHGYQVAWSPDGTRLAVTQVFGVVVLNTSNWSTVSGTPSLPIPLESVAWSPDGTRLAFGHAGAPFLTVLQKAITRQ